MIRHHGTTASLSPPGARLLCAALLAGCAALLSGCVTKSGKDVMTYAPQDYRLRHPVTLKEKDHTVELFIGNRRGGLDPAQRADVMAFAQSWRRESTGGIVVEVPSGTPNTAAATGSLKDVGAIFTAAGVPVSAVALRHYQPKRSGKFSPVRLSYPRVAAEVGPCGLWPNDVGLTADSYRDNKSYWNFGCATQRNIAAMVANPADLVQPRGETATYGARRATVLDKYRKGEQTSAAAPATAAAKISDVGK